MNPLATPEGTWSRRHLLQSFGFGTAGVAASSIALSACTPPASVSKAAAAAFTYACPFDAPPKSSYNMLYGTDGLYLESLNDLILLPGAMYRWADQTWIYLLADDTTKTSADGTELIYKVRQGLKWSDGTDVTSADVYTTWMLNLLVGTDASPYLDSVEKTDTQTVTFKLKRAAPIVTYYVLRAAVAPNSVYGEYAQRAEPFVKAGTVTTDKAAAKVVRDLTDFKPTDVVSSGPFTVDTKSVTTAQLTLKKVPTGYMAEKVAFDSVTVFASETSASMPLVLDHKVDYSNFGYASAQLKQFQKIGMRLLRSPVEFGQCILINYGKFPEFNDKRVRQALAHAIDGGQCAQVAVGPAGEAVKLQTGLSNSQAPLWLSKDAIAKLIRYDYNRDKATKLLESAGWTQKAGAWTIPSGKPAAYEMLFPSDQADTSAAATNIAAQLSDFGIKTTLRGVDSGQQDVELGKGQFEMATAPDWGSEVPFPSDAYVQEFLAYNYTEQAPNKGMNFPLVQQTDSVGKIDLLKEINDAAYAVTLAGLTAKTDRLALAFNELLPLIPIYEQISVVPTPPDKVTGWPEASNPIYQNAMYADSPMVPLMLSGTLKPAST